MIEHNFKKKFGQNFISDKNLLEAIGSDAELEDGDQVLEIGAGQGTLTSVIARKAKKVVSYEIDQDLKPALEGLNLKNVKFVFQDVMDKNLQQIESDFDGEYKIIANLPYYITSPIIFKFLGGSKRIKSMTVMVQKEVAERIIATCDSKDYGVLSVMVAFWGRAKITRVVDRKMFFPQPNVDSAVIRIDVQKEKFAEVDNKKFYDFVCACFAMRRKTLKNNLSHSPLIPQAKLKLLPEETLSLRAQSLTAEQFVSLFRQIFG